MRRGLRVALVVLPVTLVAATGCDADKKNVRDAPAPSGRTKPLPPAVSVRDRPQGVTLGDPAFTARPGARAEFGRLGGAVYQIEMPDRWNGRLVLYMHGFEELGPEAHVSAPDFRASLIARGDAWAASSFSSTGLIPGRSADETAALWDFFARRHGRPVRTYVTGSSMGGMATHIAAERYANRFDGALAMCGSAGATPGVTGQADFFVAGAFAAGVTQAEFDATRNVDALIHDRILPALRDPRAHRRFEDIMIDLTGGPRAFDRVGFEAEEATNWHRADLLVSAQIASNTGTTYHLGPVSSVTSAEFNRAVIRLPVNRRSLNDFVVGNDITGRLRMPLLSLHTTGDGQVPIEQARILQRRVDAAGEHARLVQRVMQDPGHCGFTTAEQFASLEALVGWVEHGVRPPGTNVLAGDLRTLDRTFELTPRAGLPAAEAVRGASDRVVLRGSATLDGAPVDARYAGAVVLRDGLVTPCQYTLPPVARGRYDITVLAETESSGCGAPGARVVLWIFDRDRFFYTSEAAPWPGNGHTTSFDARFLSASPDGAAPRTAQFNGEVYGRDGRKRPPGTRVEAYVGTTRCGLASTRRTGSFTGYILAVVGPDSIAGCTRGATLTLRVDGRPVSATVVNTPPGNQQALDLVLP